MNEKLKKNLRSVLTIGVVAVVLTIGTVAFFSDTETSLNNIFTAGDIDLKIGNASYAIDWNIPGYVNPVGAFVASPNTSWDLTDLTIERFFDFEDLKPGDYGEDTIGVQVGSNDAWVCAAAEITEDADNSITEPEDEDGDDGTDGNGELDEQVNFVFWVDDGDNVYEDNENIFLQGPISAMGTAGQIALADSTQSILGATNPIPGGTTFNIGKYWCFGTITQTPVAQGANSPLDATGFSCDGSGVDNQSQTDSVMANIEFYAEQARNNGNFSCAQDWTPSFGGTEPVETLVGAKLSAYVAPTGCDVTVVDEGTIQAAIDNEANHDVICVGDGTYDETVVIDRPLTLASVNGPTNTATITGGVQIVSSDVTVTGFIVNPGSILGSNAAFYLNGNHDNVVISYNDIDGLDEVASKGIETTFNGVYNNVNLMNNKIHDLTTGIYTNPHTGSAFQIKYNDVYDNAAGIGGYTGAYVAYNEFSSAGEAIGADSTYDNSVVEFNNFLAGTMFNTYGGISPDVMAPNNFWTGGSAGHIGGTMDVDPTPEAVSQYPHQ